MEIWTSDDMDDAYYNYAYYAETPGAYSFKLRTVYSIFDEDEEREIDKESEWLYDEEDFASLEMAKISSGDTTSWVCTGLKENEDYIFAVAPYVLVDGKPVESMRSDWMNCTTGVVKGKITNFGRQCHSQMVKERKRRWL